MKKYQKAYQWIKQNVLAGLQKGSILPTEKELCERLNLSKTTIRKAIRILQSDGIVNTVQGKGTIYVPGEDIRSIAGGAKKVGVVCFFLDTYIFPAILSGIEKSLNGAGYHAIIQQSEHSLQKEREAVETLLSHDIAALIAEPVIAPDGSTNEKLYRTIAADIPVIFLDNPLPAMPVHALMSDDVLAGEMAARTAFEYGHRSFGFVCQREYTPKANRIAGAKNFLRSVGVQWDEAHSIEVQGQGRSSNVTQKLDEYFGGEASGAARGGKNIPTVFICSNDEEAAEFMRVAGRHGVRVPRDVSVIGFDNSRFGEALLPALTSVSHPRYEMGALAGRIVRYLCEDAESASSSFTVTFHPAVTVRDSLAKIQQ